MRPEAVERNDTDRHHSRMILIVRSAILIVNIPMARMGKRATDVLERFGQRVRELRKEQGYSQEGFAAACELVLEALVARRKISRSDEGRYARAISEKRRRPGEDYFGGLSA